MFFEENGVALEWNPPNILESNEEIMLMWNLINGNIVRDKDKIVVGVDSIALIPILQYFKIEPKNSTKILSDLNHFARIIYEGK